jgi:hypothetical protein
VLTRHLDQRLRGLGAIGSRLEPLGQKLELCVPVRVRPGHEQHRPQLLPRRAPHHHVAARVRAAQHLGQVPHARRRASAPVQLRDGGQSHCGLAVAESALQQRQGGLPGLTVLRLARGESRVGLEQVRALLPRQAPGVHEHVRECRRRISGESGA